MSKEKVIKAFKAIKAGAKRVKIYQLDFALLCSDGDQELKLWLDTEGVRQTERAWDKLELFELEAELGHDLVEIPGEPDGLAVSADEWANIVWVALATDPDATRYALAGVLFEGQSAVATDGRRLHHAKLHSGFGGDNLTQIVPARAVKAVAALIKLFRDPSVLVSFGRNSVTVSGEKWRFVSRLIEGKFPNWRQVCPHLTGHSYLRKVTFFASTLADAKAAAARCKLEIKAGLRSMDAPIFYEILPECDNGAACLVDPRYLIDGLALLGKSQSISATVEESRHATLTIHGDLAFAIICPAGGGETGKEKAARLEREREAAVAASAG